MLIKKKNYGVGSKLKLESPSPCSRIFLAHVSCWQQTKPTIISSILGNRSASTSPLLQIIHNDLRASMGNKNSYNITFLFSPPITLITSFFKEPKNFQILCIRLLALECEDYSIEDSLSQSELSQPKSKYSYFPSLYT